MNVSIYLFSLLFILFLLFPQAILLTYLLLLHFFIFSGNPLAMAAGIKTLEILRRPGSYEHLEKITSRLVAGENKTCAVYCSMLSPSLMYLNHSNSPLTSLVSLTLYFPHPLLPLFCLLYPPSLSPTLYLSTLYLPLPSFHSPFLSYSLPHPTLPSLHLPLLYPPPPSTFLYLSLNLNIYLSHLPFTHLAGILAAAKEHGHAACGGSISGMYGFFFTEGTYCTRTVLTLIDNKI